MSHHASKVVNRCHLSEGEEKNIATTTLTVHFMGVWSDTYRLEVDETWHVRIEITLCVTCYFDRSNSFDSTPPAPAGSPHAYGLFHGKEKSPAKLCIAQRWKL
jgi:hypothetical protein